MRRELEQFFSTDSVGRVITSGLNDMYPSVALDVGFGTGSLLKAVSERWDTTRLIGIDIDPKLVYAEFDPSFNVERFMADGLDHALPEYVMNNYGNVDLVVSNPPYKSIKRTESSDLILHDAGLLSCIGSATKHYPAEIVFLAQNLRILSKNGTLAIVVPSGIINNDRWIKLRKKLIQSNKIKQVIELPDQAFLHTEAKTFVIILQKGGKTKNILLSRSDNHGNIGQTISITPNESDSRLDWSNYQKVSNYRNSKSFTIQEMDGEVFRGKFSMAEARRQNLQQIHTTSLTKSNIDLTNYYVPNFYGKVIAKEGDILIARVGSRCIGRYAFVKRGMGIVSDCVYIIRLPKHLQKHLWELIQLPWNAKSLESLARGVCAKYITKDQLLHLQFYSDNPN